MPVGDANAKVSKARRIAAAAVHKAAEHMTNPAVNRTTAIHRANKVKADALDDVLATLSDKRKR